MCDLERNLEGFVRKLPRTIMPGNFVLFDGGDDLAIDEYAHRWSAEKATKADDGS